jgi:hypothetical protein
MKWIALVLAVVGLGFGIASAYYWWSSSRESVAVLRYPPTITTSGPVVTMGPLQNYLQRVGALNARAAICGGISVFLSTISGVAGSICG